MASSSYNPLSIIDDDDDHDNSQIIMSSTKVPLHEQQSRSPRSFSDDHLESFFSIDDGEEYDDDNDDDDDNPLDVYAPTSNSNSSSPPSHPIPPTSYICPLTRQLMEDPVHDGCGHTFDRRAIASWLEEYQHDLCPISRKPLRLAHLQAAPGLRSRIERWRTQHSHMTEGNDWTTTEQQPQQQQLSMELLLLPQERMVLSIIRVRAKDRQRRRHHERCVVSVLAAAGLLVVLVTIWAVLVGHVRLQGSI